MWKQIRENWVIVLSGLTLVVWLVRLEARSNNSAPAIDAAITATQLADLKARVERIEQKVDRLLERGK